MASIVSIGFYKPGELLDQETAKALASYIKAEDFVIPTEYIEEIGNEHKFPGRIVTNEEGWEKKTWYDAWLRTLGPKYAEDPFRGQLERRYVPDDPETSRESVIPHAMFPGDAEALAAALCLMRVSNVIKKEDIDFVMSCTQIPAIMLPPGTALLHHKLRLPESAGVVSVDTCCSSFAAMLVNAKAYITSGMAKTVLVACSHIGSPIIDQAARNGPALGDGAAAALLTKATDENAIIEFATVTHGELYEAFSVAPRTPTLVRHPGHTSIERELLAFGDPQLLKQVGATSTESVKHLLEQLARKAKLDKPLDQVVDFMVTHQPTDWAPGAWCKAAGVSPAKLVESFKFFGNVGCGSLPLNFEQALQRVDLVKPGSVGLLLSSGAGENIYALLVRVPKILLDAARDVRVPQS